MVRNGRVGIAARGRSANLILVQHTTQRQTPHPRAGSTFDDSWSIRWDGEAGNGWSMIRKSWARTTGSSDGLVRWPTRTTVLVVRLLPGKGLLAGRGPVQHLAERPSKHELRAKRSALRDRATWHATGDRAMDYTV